MSSVLDWSRVGVTVSNSLRKQLDYRSAIRKGSVYRLFSGELPVVDCCQPSLVSKGNGTVVYNNGRVIADTFLVSSQVSISYEALAKAKFAAINKAKDRVIEDFIRREEEEINRRIWNTKDIIYAETDEILRLKKFYKDLGKNVAVLPNGYILDMKAMYVYVRTDPNVRIFDEPSQMRMNLLLWEDIGFVYLLDEDEKNWPEGIC